MNSENNGINEEYSKTWIVQVERDGTFQHCKAGTLLASLYDGTSLDNDIVFVICNRSCCKCIYI